MYSTGWKGELIMPEKLIHFLGSLPFMLITADGRAHVNKIRIIESIIYAVVGGLFSGYVAVKIIEVKLDMLEKKVDKIYSDIYRPSLPRP